METQNSEMESKQKISKKVVFREMVDFPSTTHGTFGIYRYPAKFIPHVVYYILRNYAKSKTKVFDPFAGCGTVGIASNIYGCDYELWDLNPMLEILHSAATMEPIEIDSQRIIEEIKSNKEKFIPEWSNREYWFPDEYLSFLYNVWGYYHSLPTSDKKLFLTVPLLKTTRYFSYDDMQRQKLSKSNKSKERVKRILSGDWEKKFFQMLKKEMNKLDKSLKEHWSLNPKNTEGKLRCGIDSLNESLTEKKDILITSPPYLQSQEYIRQAKHDLFWLGYSTKEVRKLKKLEIPYGNISPCEIHSKTYEKFRDKLNEEHMKEIFDKYFWGVLGALTRLQEDIESYMFLFVGDTSMRGHTIPLDKIFIEHLTHYGWKHEKTLIDTIVSRRMFSYGENPSSKIKDKRTAVENLVVMVF
jgi:hypothetical protein